jgi:hypothetical protein
LGLITYFPLSILREKKEIFNNKMGLICSSPEPQYKCLGVKKINELSKHTCGHKYSPNFIEKSNYQFLNWNNENASHYHIFLQQEGNSNIIIFTVTFIPQFIPIITSDLNVIDKKMPDEYIQKVLASFSPTLPQYYNQCWEYYRPRYLIILHGCLTRIGNMSDVSVLKDNLEKKIDAVD